MPSLNRFDAKLRSSGCGFIASICGRYYGMDRDKRWDRVEKAFRAIRQGHCEYRFENAPLALEAAYGRGENDEFVMPSCITTETGDTVSVKDGDAVVFMNFRADRARELTRAFVDREFNGFDRGTPPRLAAFVMLTEYATDIEAECAYPPEDLSNSLGEYLSALGLSQLRIAETEKYAHVTFFFSGGREKEFAGESRILVPSPKVATYDLQPEMSAVQVTDKLVQAILERQYDAIICNFANGDMVGHTGVMAAAIKAVETLDQCLGRIRDAILQVDGNCLITADHGNVEQMLDEDSGQPLTSHTSGPVPLVYVGKRKVHLLDDGSLSDVAPSLLALMDLKQPREMTGHSLIRFDS